MILRDLLYGVAVGDAVGNPLEFSQRVSEADAIVSLNADRLRPSDDTQMTLFLAEALTTWGGRMGELNAVLELAYINWLQTQKVDHEGWESKGLLSYKELYSVESPGTTCVGSTYNLLLGKPVENTSKGNGTVMRCSPIALYGFRRNLHDSELIQMATIDAEVTHKHPYAAIASCMQVLILHRLMQDYPLSVAVRSASGAMVSVVGAQHPVIDLAIDALDKKKFVEMRESMGAWVAEEALALAIGSVAHSTTYKSAIVKAVSITGDSDTVAAIAGALAVCNALPVPESLKKKVTLAAPIEYLSGMPFWSE